MLEDYGAGCIATVLIDNHLSDYGYEFDQKLIYTEYIRSDTWKEKANAAKERAGHRCQVCNGNDRLEAHHRTYARLGDEIPEDITVLCHKCHEKFSKSITSWFI